MDAEGTAFIMGITLGIVLSMFLTFVVIDPDEIWHKKIIEKGCGEYNSTTGEFQWK